MNKKTPNTFKFSRQIIWKYMIEILLEQNFSYSQVPISFLNVSSFIFLRKQIWFCPNFKCFPPESCLQIVAYASGIYTVVKERIHIDWDWCWTIHSSKPNCVLNLSQQNFRTRFTSQAPQLCQHFSGFPGNRFHCDHYLIIIIISQQ